MAAHRKPRPGRRGSSSFPAGLGPGSPACWLGRAALLSAGTEALPHYPSRGQSPWERCPAGLGVPPGAWTRLAKAGPGPGPELCPLGSEQAQVGLALLSPLGRMVVAGGDARAWPLLGPQSRSASWDQGRGSDEPRRVGTMLGPLSVNPPSIEGAPRESRAPGWHQGEAESEQTRSRRSPCGG